MSSTKSSFPASAFLVVLAQPETVTVVPTREASERSCGMSEAATVGERSEETRKGKERSDN